MTSKEAIQIIQDNLPPKLLGILQVEINIIKQALERLGTLEQRFDDMYISLNKVINANTNVIKELTEENEKLKKAIKILKKIVSIPLEDDFAKVKIDKETKEETHYYALSIKYLIDEQEYELLKEVLENA